MRISSIKLKNYRQFKEAHIEFPDGVIGLVGLNGTGKSSLVEAVAWTLFGNIASRTDKEGIKRTGASPAEPCEASLEIEIGPDSYRIVRALKGSSQTGAASVFANGKKIADSVKGCEKEIAHILDMDFKSFYTSFYAKQKELNALSDLNPNQRKDIIIRMLRIDAVDRAIDRIRAESRDTKKIIEIRRASIKDTTELESLKFQKEKEIEKASAESGSLFNKISAAQKRENEFKDIFSKERKKYEDYNAQKIELSKCQSRSSELKKKSEEIKALVARIDSLETELKEIAPQAQSYEEWDLKDKQKEELRKSEKDELFKEKAELKEKVGKLEGERGSLEKIFKEVRSKKNVISSSGKESKCPTCGQLLQNFEDIIKHYDEELEKITAEGKAVAVKKKEIEAKLAEIDLLIEQLERSPRKKSSKRPKYDFEEHEKIKTEKEKAKKAKDRQIELKAKIERKKELEDSLDKTGEELSSIKAKIIKAEKDLELTDYKKEDYEKINKEYDEARADLDRLKQKKNAFDIEKASLQKELEAIVREIKEAQDLKKIIDKELKDSEFLSRLEDIMIEYRTHLISRIRPQLIETASYLYRELTDGKYTGLDIDEDYNMRIFDGGYPYPLTRFSGGEADLANLCIRLAISQLISARAGTEGGFIILDEIFGSQDIVRKNSIMTALNQLNKQFRQIIVITHVDDIKDTFEHVIEVTEDELGISSAKLL